MNSKERSRFLRFAFVGAIGAVVDFGIFNFLSSTKILPAIWASVVSFICAVVSNFIWNRFWTYPDSRGKKVGHQVFQFTIVSLIGLGIRTPLFAWLEKVLVVQAAHWFPNFFLTPTFIGHNSALAIAVLVVMMWNFIANRYWTYNDVK